MEVAGGDARGSLLLASWLARAPARQMRGGRHGGSIWRIRASTRTWRACRTPYITRTHVGYFFIIVSELKLGLHRIDRRRRMCSHVRHGLDRHLTKECPESTSHFIMDQGRYSDGVARTTVPCRRYVMARSEIYREITSLSGRCSLGNATVYLAVEYHLARPGFEGLHPPCPPPLHVDPWHA